VAQWRTVTCKLRLGNCMLLQQWQSCRMMQQLCGCSKRAALQQLGPPEWRFSAVQGESRMLTQLSVGGVEAGGLCVVVLGSILTVMLWRFGREVLVTLKAHVLYV
jgi:hypothetical protein